METKDVKRMVENVEEEFKEEMDPEEMDPQEFDLHLAKLARRSSLLERIRVLYYQQNGWINLEWVSIIDDQCPHCRKRLNLKDPVFKIQLCECKHWIIVDDVFGRILSREMRIPQELRLVC